MANRAYLYAGNEDGPPGGPDEQVLGANYLIPALWLAILEEDELEHVVETARGREATYYFSIGVEEALTRCERRGEALRACVSNVDDYLPAWLDLLRALKGRYIKIDPTEVLWMGDSEQSTVSELRKALAFLDSPTEENTEAFLKVTCLGDVYDADSQEVHDSPGKLVSEAFGEDSTEYRGMGDRRLPDHQARVYMTGYKIADWVRWETPGHQDRAHPAKSAPSTRPQRLDWHPMTPLSIMAAFLWFTRSSEWTWFRVLGAAVLSLWLSLSVFDLASKGRFTSWLYRDG
jgi:hypothetical protein